MVSLVQSCLINSLALWVIYMDRERRAMGPRERVWGYTGAGGMVQAFSAGYFLWDLMTGIIDVDIHGWGTVAHAISALAVSGLGFVCFLLFFSIFSTFLFFSNFFLFGEIWEGECGLWKMTNRLTIDPETIRKLLWLEFHTLRVINPISQHSLVYGQAWHDGIDGSTDQWDHFDCNFWREPITLGHISIHPDVSGRVGGFQNARGTSGPALACCCLSDEYHDAKRA